MSCAPPFPVGSGSTAPVIPPTSATINPDVPDVDLPLIPGEGPTFLYLEFPTDFVGDGPVGNYGNPQVTYSFTCPGSGDPVSVIVPANTYTVFGPQTPAQAYADYLAAQAAQQAATVQCQGAGGGGGSQQPAVGDFSNVEISASVQCAA